MIGRVVLAIFTGAAVSLTLPPSDASAVIGGDVAKYGPWAARMLVDGKPECTATVLSRQWIIGAGHCFFESGAPIADSRIQFRVGNLDQRKGKTVRPVGRRESAAVPDIMLIKVSPMSVKPAQLPTSAAVRPGQIVRQAGWGATCTSDENSCQSNVLKQAELKVLPASDDRCFGYGTDDGTDFCMVSTHGEPAGGDSGAPIMATGKGKQDLLVGVFARSDRAQMAGAGDVFHQLSWIRKTIAK